jgi:predicted amidohydrolase
VSTQRWFLSAALIITSGLVSAETPQPLKPYIAEDAPVLVLEHVRVIDGTGAAPVEDQRIEIVDGKIARVISARLRIAYPAGAKVLDLTGKTVIPGIVGMHEQGICHSAQRVSISDRKYVAIRFEFSV